MIRMPLAQKRASSGLYRLTGKSTHYNPAEKQATPTLWAAIPTCGLVYDLVDRSISEIVLGSLFKTPLRRSSLGTLARKAMMPVGY